MNEYQPISSLGWIDFSETDKNKVLKVLEMLKPSGTVDELGVGVVRDSLSDVLFPGITTIMTRAKYYFIVPRILCTYLIDRKINRKVQMRDYLREQENEIIQNLANNYGYNEAQRIIGINIALHNKDLPRRRWKELVRKPSSVYWNGMKTFKIYEGELPLSVFLDHFNVNNIEQEIGYDAHEGEMGDDRDAHIIEKLPFDLPSYDKKWNESLRLELSSEEASFLRHKIIDNCPETLLAELMKNNSYCKEFLKANSFQDLCSKKFITKLPHMIKTNIYLARDFWKIMEGAHIRYNILLQEKKGIDKDLQNEFNKKWDNWVNEIKVFEWNTFEKSALWEIIRSKKRHVKDNTLKFIDQWIEHIAQRNFAEKTLDELVAKQESKNKGNRSKLSAGNDDKYESWVGLDTMSFRFGNAKLIVNDILKGLYDAGL